MTIKLPEIITEEELIEILKVTKSPQHHIAFALGFYEAMRVSEIVNLNRDNIDKQQRLLRIKKAKDSKDSKDRNIPIAPQVFESLEHVPLTIGVRALQTAFKKCSQEALGKDLHFHQLRHSGISHYLVKKKWSPVDVQRFAGHSRISATKAYTHINPQDLVNRMWND